MPRTLARRLAALALAVVALVPLGCGHYHHYGYGYYNDYYGYNGYDHSFTLTLVNDTNMVLIPGPVVIYPSDDVYGSLPALAPGASIDLHFSYVPSSIRLSAVATDGVTYVYPTHTLDAGIDYSYSSYGTTFFFQ